MIRRLTITGVVLCALSATSCADYLDPPAATVGGVAISEEVIREELEILEANPEFAPALLGAGPTGEGLTVEASGSSTSRISSIAANRLIGRRALYQVVSNELTDRSITVSDVEVSAELDRLTASLPPSFGALPADYRRDIASGEAARLKLAEALADESGAPAPLSAREFFDANEDSFVESCTRHILVATEDEALAALDRLESGDIFAEVAAEVSIDTGSAAAQGVVGCVRPGQLTPEYELVAFSAEPGVLSGPVESPFGFHLIIVDSVGPVAFADVEQVLVADIEQSRAAAVNQSFAQWFETNRGSFDIEVDSRYGTWDPGTFSIVPTAGPSVAE